MLSKPGKIEPGPGQESVWDYPRPPKLEESERHITITHHDKLIVDSRSAYRVLETSHPPTYYFSPDTVRAEFLIAVQGSTFCEWKGSASYYDLLVGDHRVSRAAWYYHNPNSAYDPIRNYISFYPGKMDECVVDGELIEAQEGDFYGGWITEDIVGPFKGASGTGFW